MFRRLGRHIQANAVAYLALFFAIGGGGGYAVAATTASSTTIHACVSKKNGALYVAKKCSKSERALTFNQRGPAGATGASQPTIVGQVATGGGPLGMVGMTVTQGATAGEYNVGVTACPSGRSANLVASPIGPTDVTGSAPPEVEVTPVSGLTFTVSAGSIENGTFEPNSDQGFYLIGECE